MNNKNRNIKAVFRKIIMICFLLSTEISCLQAQQLLHTKPNIIVIITDQQFADAMSFRMGKQWINTPNMDKLATHGVVFTRAYAANPICAPSRNSILTGQYPHITGIESNDKQNELYKNNAYFTGSRFKSMGTYFKKAGYETAYFGKWHFNFDPLNKNANGFDIVRFATGEGDDDSLPTLVNKFLKEKHKKPFLLFLSFLNPHNVCEWSRFQVLSNGSIGSMPLLNRLPPLPDNFLPPADKSDAMTLMRKSYHNNLRLFTVANYTAYDWRRLRWGYYRLIEKVDSLIGKVFISIEKNGYNDNSLILYTSDHGSCVGAHHFVQKTVFYDESSRIPFILKYNGVLKPSLNKTLVNIGVDILPTLLDFAGIKKPAELPGNSVKAAAKKEKTLPVPYIIVENKMAQGGPVDGSIPIANGRMVRSEKYKYCLYDIGKYREELYDMETGRGEKVNIAYKKSSQPIIERLRADLYDFATKHKDTLALRILHSVGLKKIITVASKEEIYSVLDSLEPGDTLCLKDGVYKDVKLVINQSGEPGSLIYIKAKNPGKVFFSGDVKVELRGEYLVLEGIYFVNGDRNVEQWKSHGPGIVAMYGSHNRITQCAFNAFDEANSAWITTSIPEDGKVPGYCRIDHCSFINKITFDQVINLNNTRKAITDGSAGG